jgi:hypothetical protein
MSSATHALARKSALVLPYSYALLLPLLPLLIELASVVPRGIAVVGRGFALGLALIVTAVAVVSVAACVRAWGWKALSRTPLSLALGALIVTEAIASAAGIAWRAGMFEVLCEIGNAIAFAVFWLTMRDDRPRRTFLALFFGSGLAACAFAIALTLSRHPPAQFAYEHGRAAGTFLQPNEFAGYLIFLIPLGIAQAGAPNWLWRLGWLSAAVGAIAIAMSASRAAVLGLLLALPILMARFGRRAFVAYLAVAAITIFLGITIGRNVAHDPSENASRIAVWQGAARMAERFALVGIGPLAFSTAYPLYKMPDAQIDEVHAHDLPLNILIENGVLGLAALAFAAFASYRAGRAAAKNIGAADKERGLLLAGLSAAFGASVLQNGVDLVSTFVFLMWWPMLGLLTGMARTEADVASG